MSAGNLPPNNMAKKLRKASTILLKMILYDLGYTLAQYQCAREWLFGCI